MNPIPFEGAMEVGKPVDMTDEECMSVWCIRGIDNQNYPFHLVCWKPNYEDIQAIQKGEPIWLKFIGRGLPPHILYTMNPDTQEINQED